MEIQKEITPEQSFFAVFCIEALADDLATTGDKIYIMLAENGDMKNCRLRKRRRWSKYAERIICLV